MTFIPQVLTTMDSNNTTTTPLSSSSTFSGVFTLCTGYNSLIVTVSSDQNSSAGGIEIIFSDDGTTDSFTFSDTYFANSKYIKNYQIIKKYYRINYVNGSVSQTSFSLQSRLSTDISSNAVTYNDSITTFNNNVENTLDAFGKLRVSMPTTLLDIRFPGQSTGSSNFLNNTLQVSNTSNGTYTGTYGNSKLVISATGTGYYVSQSRNYCVYQPGKSLLFLASGIIYPGNNAYTTRIGYFDNEVPLATPLVVRNGLYFEHSGGVYSINIKNNTTTTVNQADWNIDRMDGTGPSGLNLDFTNTQLFVIDMEWLGVGRIRFGFYGYGRIQYCHQITNINILTEPYTNSINLPICYTIHNNAGTVASATTFTQICSTVISEGGYNPRGRPFAISNGDTGISVTDVETPVLFLRGGTTNYYHQNILPTSLSAISSSTNDFMLYRLRLYLDGDSPVSGGSITWSNVNTTYSVCQYSATYTGTFQVSNSVIVDQNYFFGRGTNSFTSLSDVFSSQIQQITSNSSNVSDVLVLTCEKIGSASASTIYGNFNWQEIY